MFALTVSQSITTWLVCLSLFYYCADTHPVWDISTIIANNTSFSNENDFVNIVDGTVDEEDSKGILDIVNSIVSGTTTVKCATGQGQEGFCTMQTCEQLGQFNAITCPGKIGSYLKCCPYNNATEITPQKINGCGVRPVKPNSLIVGGHEAQPHSWPWAIALYRVNNGRKYFQCGGSIIDRQYVLCAAHCIKRPFQTLTADDFVVKVGAHELGNSGEFRQLETIIAHENYSPTYHNDDIALLRLKEPLDFDDTHMAPVCLPEADQVEGRRVGRMATMVGWGVHSQTEFAASPSLYQVQIPISDMENCKKAYTELMGPNAYLNWTNVVCASYNEGGKDTCQGDSGGPMAVADSQGVYSQVGVVSFGYGCAQKGYPGVYTYVPNYVHWIGAHMVN